MCEEFVKGKYDSETGTYIETKVYVPNERVYLPCDCGCGMIGLSMWPDGDSYILYYGLTFDDKQSPIKNTLKEKIKLIWACLTGKEYRFFEITVGKEKLLELSEKIQKYIKENN